MGTLSFLRLAQGYSLMVDRATAAASPRVEHIAQASVAGAEDQVLRVLYPVDPASGGTWAGVNDRGIAFALLGEACTLVPEALRGSSAGGGLERVAAMDLGSEAPFQLVGLEEGHAPLSLIWDGQALQRRLHPDTALVLSSEPLAESVGLDGEGKGEAELLAAQEVFHMAHFGHGESFTQVLVLPAMIVLRYLDQEATENGQEAELVTLKRDGAP